MLGKWISFFIFRMINIGIFSSTLEPVFQKWRNWLLRTRTATQVFGWTCWVCLLQILYVLCFKSGTFEITNIILHSGHGTFSFIESRANDVWLFFWGIVAFSRNKIILFKSKLLFTFRRIVQIIVEDGEFSFGVNLKVLLGWISWDWIWFKEMLLIFDLAFRGIEIIDSLCGGICDSDIIR